MFLEKIRIRNFRGLEDIEVTFKEKLNVIVGPNAVGKSTLLESIRIAQALLAQRLPDDAEHTLRQIGAMSPHTGVVDYSSIALDIRKTVEIDLKIKINLVEYEKILQNKSRLILIHIRNTQGISPNQSDVSLIQFLSSSGGQQIKEQASKIIEEELDKLQTTLNLRIELRIDGENQYLRGNDLFSQEVIKVLQDSLPPSQTFTSYFPADRAMPSGEVGIQLGSADTLNQLRSHFVQPDLKYQRLKQIVIQQYLLGIETKKQLDESFSLIFSELLVGKKLNSISVSPIGTLSILIEEIDSKRTYDIDRMSSGEKGLILQFLLMRNAIADGGLVLLDEPELHLNPAVSKKLVDFLLKNVAIPKNIQFIICTHSPEILAEALEHKECSLFHLRSSKDISPIYSHDRTEIFSALKKLGAETSDILFSRGTVFVEGQDDSEILEAGFRSRVKGYKINVLRGRNEIEKEIRKLQKSEKDGDLKTKHFFIFDRDRKPTELESTENIKILQWDRYCLENYLLESDAIYDVSMSETLQCKSPPESRGAFKIKMKELAFKQLLPLVAKETYRELEPENPGIRPSDLNKESFDDIAESIASKLMTIKFQVEKIQKEPWVENFLMESNKIFQEKKSIWEDDWAHECDGKSVLDQIYKSLRMNISFIDFKKRIINQMSQNRSENWSVIDSKLSGLFE